MRVDSKAESYRIISGRLASKRGDNFGAFIIPGPEGEALRIIASPGDKKEGIPWEHVSVSCKTRCPHWKEMCFIKDLFWDAEEAVMQLHPPRLEWINNHNYCLHMWKPMDKAIELPPNIAVGYKELNLK